MSVIGNGSAQLSFSEVLPGSKDNAVFNASDFMSKQIGGKKRTQKRKQKGGNATPALEFTEFTPDNSAPASVGNPTIDMALNAKDLPPSNAQSPDVVPDTMAGGSPAAIGADGNPTPTNPSISIGGKRRSKRRSSKKNGKYSKRKGGARKRRSSKKSKKNSKKSS